MVAYKIDIQSAFARPTESEPVIPSHAHRPAFRPALQAVEAKASNLPILRLPRYFQPLQDGLALRDMIGAGAVDLFKPGCRKPPSITVSSAPPGREQYRAQC